MRPNRTTNIIASCSILFAGAAWPARAQVRIERTLTTTIEVSIGSGIRDGTSNTLIVGSMAIKVDDTGAFTGDITPARDNLGNMLPGVVFRGSDFYPDLSLPQSLKVSGQMNGRAIVFTVSVSDGTSNTPMVAESFPTIFGTGMSSTDLSKLDSGPITGVMAGTASAHAIIADGSVRLLSNTISSATWAASSAGMQFAFDDGSVRFIR